MEHFQGSGEYHEGCYGGWCRMRDGEPLRHRLQGVKSCFACKIKNSKCNGVCALKDEKRHYRDEHFETDMKRVYELGRRLVEKCKE